jgi:hypothetical protein
VVGVFGADAAGRGVVVLVARVFASQHFTLSGDLFLGGLVDS